MTTELTPEWLAAQRWFRSKQRPIATVATVDRARVEGTRLWLNVVAVAYVDGGGNELYLVPTDRTGDPDAVAGIWRGILGAIAAERTLDGDHGEFQCRRAAGFGRLVTDLEPDERPLGVEQSNTSVGLGTRLILKLYRRLEPGVNPDLEVSDFLSEVGFADTPAVAGSVTYAAFLPAPAAAVMVQERIEADGDAWASLLGALARDPAEGVRQAGAIGRTTAAMHDALAARPDDPAFPARGASTAERAAWRASAERQLAAAVTAVGGEAHDALVAVAPKLTAAFADTFESAPDARVTRIHGDYHLGQLLARREGGFAVIDFEGEPARPLVERRAPSSPVRDVAGMLRSFDYAARTAEAGEHAAGFRPEAWLAEARAAFLDAYGARGTVDPRLLAAFELEKACYEVRYEANNRPDWLWLPLAAVERLAAGLP